MALYRHYSFDLWLTLIRSNPAFKTERTRYFYERYNYARKSTEEIALAFRQVDLMCNAINENTGKNIDADEMYLMVLSLINNHQLPLQDIDVAQLGNEMNQLLFNYLPLVYCSQTKTVLQHLKQQGSTVSLLSNTGFIKGEVLRRVLQHLELSPFLDFQLYSDEARLSKPNPQFFRQMLYEVTQLQPGIQPEQIVHIGDNAHADIKGAQGIGIHSKLINSNHQCINTIIS